MALLSQLFRGDAKLEAAAVSDPAHIVPGVRGDHVGKIQQALIQLDGATIAADSSYGPATSAAVSAFKQKRDILNFQGKIDNIVGKKTIAALDAEMLAKENGGGGGGGGSGGNRRGIVFDRVRTRRHTMIYFSGVADDNGLGGVLLTGAHGQAVMTDMENLRTVSPNEKIVFGFGGSIKNRLAGVAQAAAFLATLHDKRGKIIIYGFSAGGVNALDLCRELNKTNTKVNLLVTVDVAAKKEAVDRSVPGNVTLNRNYFQTTESLSGSRGGPASGTGVQNIPCDNRSFNFFLPKSSKHGQMQDVTRSDAKSDMSKELGAP